MVDLSPSTTLAAPLTSVAGNNAGTLTPIAVPITDVSAGLENLTYTLSTSASVQSLDGANLVLSLAAGQLTVDLQQLAAAARQNLQQILIDLVGTQKTISLSIAAGNPPTQAVLLLPTSGGNQTSIAGGADLSLNINHLASAAPTPPIITPTVTPGTILSAWVLPPDAQVNTPVALFPTVDRYSAFTGSSQPSPQSLQNPALASEPISAVSRSDTVSSAISGLPAENSSQVTANTSASTNAPQAQIGRNFTPDIGNAGNTSSILQPGAQVDLRVLSVTLPKTAAANGANAAIPTDVSAAPANTPAPLNNPVALKATVTNVTPDGKTVLQINDAVLYIKNPTNLTVNSTLAVVLQPVKHSDPLVLQVPPSGSPSLPTLSQALGLIQHLSPPLFQQTLGILPQPNEALAATLLLLLGSFKKGDVRGWLGDQPAKILINSGKGETLSALSCEFSHAEQPAHDTVVGEWRAYPIPLYAQAKIQELTLYVHRDRKDSDQPASQTKASAGNKVRFMIDFSLSKLGAMQLDGFMQPRKIDMLLRHEKHLPDGLHEHLRAAYINAISAVGLAGSLNFQIGRQSWLVMKKEGTDGVVT